MSEQGYVVFLWKTSGYELEEREGEPPKVGEQVDDGLVVAKVGASPLPGDRRPCVFTSGA